MLRLQYELIGESPGRRCPEDSLFRLIFDTGCFEYRILDDDCPVDLAETGGILCNPTGKADPVRFRRWDCLSLLNGSNAGSSQSDKPGAYTSSMQPSHAVSMDDRFASYPDSCFIN